MSIFTEPKIDCHNHVLDPARFPYAADTPYRPSGQEIAPAAHMLRMLDVYNVRHALVVGTNSGYGADNRCLLDAIATSNGRFKGVAVVENNVGMDELRRLKSLGIIGIAINATFHGTDYYRGVRPLIEKMAELDLMLQVQVQDEQLLEFLPLLEDAPAKLLFDHCGRPSPDTGIQQPGFQALLALGRSGRAAVKISGLYKFSRQPYPHADAWPYVDALVEAFSLPNCVWGSDWPFLRAPERLDYGPLLTLVERLFPDPKHQRMLLWENPNRLFGFGGETTAI